MVVECGGDHPFGFRVMQLRPYQQDALLALFAYWRSGGGNPLLALATGTGKSVIIAFLLKQLLSDYPKMRVLITAPNRELIDQDIKELKKVWPDALIGINCEGLGSRDTDAQILVVTINSIYRNPQAIGPRELILVDEAHLIPHAEQGMYRTTIAALHGLVPDLRVAGLTATPYRLDGGHLCEGEGHIFDSVVFEYPIARGIREGFLSPLRSKAAKTLIDVSGVGKRGGEFIAEQLEAVASELDVVAGAADEIVAHAGNGPGKRRAWLAFCVGVKHAELMCDALRARGINAEMVLGETDDDERNRIIEEFRAGRLTCIVSVMVLSYGFNVPFVDLVALLRPTCSTGLYVQQVGRGTRKADGKDDCLVLDFAGNVRRFGPVDDPRITTKGNGNGEAPTKTCPECDEIVALAATECPACGYEFPAKAKKIKHAAQADSAEVLSSERRVSDWLAVEDVEFRKHIKETPSLRVSYQCGIDTFSEWICLEHQGLARTKAEVWWRALAGTGVPHTVNEALARDDEIAWPSHIRVAPDGKYWRIIGRRIDGVEYDVDLRPDWRSQPKPEITDDVPY
jgi:DNA repair protein RadD